MNSRRRNDELDRLIREGNSYSNIVLGCLIGAAGLVVVFFLIGLGVILLNWRNGTLLAPVFPPQDFWGDRIENP